MRIFACSYQNRQRRIAPGQEAFANVAFYRNITITEEGLTLDNFPPAKEFDSWSSKLNSIGIAVENNSLRMTPSPDGKSFPFMIYAPGRFCHNEIDGNSKGNMQMVSLGLSYLKRWKDDHPDKTLASWVIRVPNVF